MGRILKLEPKRLIVQTAALGRLELRTDDVLSVHWTAGNRRAAPDSSLGQAPAQRKDDAFGMLNGLMQTISGNPDIMKQVSRLAEDPEIQKLMQDPQVRKAVESGNLLDLLRNPKVLGLLRNRKVQEISQEVLKSRPPKNPK